MHNPGAAEVIVDHEQERLVLGDLAQRALRELVELGRVGELDQERAQLALLRQRRHAQEDRAGLLVLGDRLQRLEILQPLAEHQSLSALMDTPSRASASSSSSNSLVTGISRPRAVTRALNPVTRSAATRTRSAS